LKGLDPALSASEIEPDRVFKNLFTPAHVAHLKLLNGG